MSTITGLNALDIAAFTPQGTASQPGQPQPISSFVFKGLRAAFPELFVKQTSDTVATFNAALTASREVDFNEVTTKFLAVTLYVAISNTTDSGKVANFKAIGASLGLNSIITATAALVA